MIEEERSISSESTVEMMAARTMAIKSPVNNAGNNDLPH